MTRAEDSLQYTAEHEWVELDGDLATVGITAYAADQLGDIVYVQLPEVGDEVTAGASVGELESTKSVGDLFSPVTGTVEAVNEALADGPELVNSDPLGEGWLIRVRATAVPDLLDLGAYRALTEQR
jgi:glycine cleavage system H protein